MVEKFEKGISRRGLLNGTVKIGGGAIVAALSVPAAQLFAEMSQQTVPGGEGTTALETAAGMSSHESRFAAVFLSNKSWQDLALNFSDSPDRANRLAGSGALVQANGDVRFRIYAPNATKVSVRFDLVRKGELALTKQPDGYFEGVLRYEASHSGPMTADVYVDGMLFLYPAMPIHWSGNWPRNYVEVPDSALEFLELKDVAHGAVCREVYWSEALKGWMRCMVYTPPGYMKSLRSCPVLYLHHGFGENETVWGHCGKVAYMLDNLIAAGSAEPMLVVMNNIMQRYPETASGVIDDAYERTLLESCIPYMEKNYRVATGKWNRAIAGLSLGAYMSSDIAFRHPGIFGSLGTFTASMKHEQLRMSYTRNYAEVMRNAEKFAANYKVYFRSTTRQEDHFEYFEAEDQLCAEHGVDKAPGYHRVVYSAQTTKWNSWRMGMRDFAQLLFR